MPNAAAAVTARSCGHRHDHAAGRRPRRSSSVRSGARSGGRSRPGIRTISARAASASAASTSSGADGRDHRRQRARQRRADHERRVEAGRLERVRRRQQLAGHERRDHAGEAAERQRVGDPGGDHDERQHPVRRVPDQQHERDEHRRDHELVDHHQRAAPAGQVEPGAEQRAAHEAREGDRRHRRAGQAGAAGAVEHEQDDADGEHLVGHARERGRRHEPEVAGLRAQPPERVAVHQRAGGIACGKRNRKSGSTCFLIVAQAGEVRAVVRALPVVEVGVDVVLVRLARDVRAERVPHAVDPAPAGAPGRRAAEVGEVLEREEHVAVDERRGVGGRPVERAAVGVEEQRAGAERRRALAPLDPVDHPCAAARADRPVEVVRLRVEARARGAVAGGQPAVEAAGPAQHHREVAERAGGEARAGDARERPHQPPQRRLAAEVLAERGHPRRARAAGGAERQDRCERAPARAARTAARRRSPRSPGTTARTRRSTRRARRGVSRSVSEVTTPKLPPPPPRHAQYRSSFVLASTWRTRPSAVTIARRDAGCRS